MFWYWFFLFLCICVCQYSAHGPIFLLRSSDCACSWLIQIMYEYQHLHMFVYAYMHVCCTYVYIHTHMRTLVHRYTYIQTQCNISCHNFMDTFLQTKTAYVVHEHIQYSNMHAWIHTYTLYTHIHSVLVTLLWRSTRDAQT